MNTHKYEYVIFVSGDDGEWTAVVHERDEDDEPGVSIVTGIGGTPTRAVKAAFKEIGQ